MKPKVCMMTYHYWPGPEGGTEKQCRRLATVLSQREVPCTVLTTRAKQGDPTFEHDGPVNIVRLPILEEFQRRPGSPVVASTPSTPKRVIPLTSRLAASALAWVNALLFQVSAAVFLARHATEFNVIHVHTSEWIAGYAVWLGRLVGLPVLCKVATLPALPVSTQRVPLSGLWARQRTQADFIALNDVMASELISAGIPKRRIRVIPNGVELPDLSQRCEDTELVLYVGNMSQSEYKAFDVLFDAWTIVNASRPSARLAVLGNGDTTLWENYLKERNCRESVSFEGFVQDVNIYYRVAALLVLPSRQEGMSNALLEAQSWGIPAVVSDIAANRAVVKNEENGLVVPVNNAHALAAEIVRVLSDRKLRISLGTAARQQIEERYCIESVVGQTLMVYEELLHASINKPAEKEGL